MLLLQPGTPIQACGGAELDLLLISINQTGLWAYPKASTWQPSICFQKEDAGDKDVNIW